MVRYPAIRKRLIIIVFLFFHISAKSQEAAAVDSLRNKYLHAVTDREKVNLASQLSQLLMSYDFKQADSFGKKAIEIAEFSRDRDLMIKAYRVNGIRYSYVAGKKENITIALNYLNKAYALSRESKAEEEQAKCLLNLSSVYCLIPDADKAMGYTNQAFSLVGNTSSDSLETECYISFGDCYLLKKEKLLALKNYFNASRLAEETRNIKSKNGKISLKRRVYTKLREFYASIEDYDKSLDYAVQAKDLLYLMDEGGEKYALTTDLHYIGGLFSDKKEWELSRLSYEESIRLADSLKFDALKIPGYLGLLNMYLNANKPQEALEYFNRNRELRDYINRIGFSGAVDHAYGYIYMELGQLDSAERFLYRARPFFENVANNTNKINFFDHLHLFDLKSGDYRQAITDLGVARQVAEDMHDIEWQQRICRQLDSVYQLSGDFKQAVQYSSLSDKLKDSIEQLGKQEDLLQLQINEEQQRQHRLAEQAEERKKERHRFQNIMITIGIVVLFILLVTLGMFRVSAATIRVLGFFTFLMLFEFLFLLFKKQVYGFTKGEPIYDLMFMIGLAAVLVPLHHWLEHKVIHYLTTHNRLTLTKGRDFFKNIFRKNETTS